MCLAGSLTCDLDRDMAYVQANTNGRLHPADEPSIAPLNRGFLYGDAIYEVWRTYEHVLFAWEEHWARLERSASALFLTIPVTRPGLLEEIRKTVAAFRSRVSQVQDIYVRLQITRGGGPIGLDVALADRADYVLLVQANPSLPPEKLRSGLVLSQARSLRRNARDTLNPAWKTGNYLNNILCLREARARGADEVVISNLDGEITEAAVSNIAFVAGGVVVTPPTGAGILEGVTRGILVNSVARAAGVEVQERAIRPEELGAFEECFLLSTTKDIVPVRSIDSYAFRTGDNTITMTLKRAFAAYAADYIATHRSKLSVPGF